MQHPPLAAVLLRAGLRHRCDVVGVSIHHGLAQLMLPQLMQPWLWLECFPCPCSCSCSSSCRCSSPCSCYCSLPLRAARYRGPQNRYCGHCKHWNRDCGPFACSGGLCCPRWIYLRGPSANTSRRPLLRICRPTLHLDEIYLVRGYVLIIVFSRGPGFLFSSLMHTRARTRTKFENCASGERAYFIRIWIKLINLLIRRMYKLNQIT